MNTFFWSFVIALVALAAVVVPVAGLDVALLLAFPAGLAVIARLTLAAWNSGHRYAADAYAQQFGRRGPGTRMYGLRSRS